MEVNVISKIPSFLASNQGLNTFRWTLRKGRDSHKLPLKIFGLFLKDLSTAKDALTDRGLLEHESDQCDGFVKGLSVRAQEAEGD